MLKILKMCDKMKKSAIINKGSINYVNNVWIISIIVSLIIFICLNSIVEAAPTPMGVDGVVYGLDGLTQAPTGTVVKVINMNSGQILVGSTGKGSSGRFSFSIDWPKNTPIKVFTETQYNNASVELNLTGVVRNVFLLLNISMPQQPPLINSVPENVAYVGQTYYYQVSVFDPDSDVLLFFLMQGPNGMNISENGVVEWVPSINQTGNQSVIVVVSDNYFNVSQEFNIEVYDLTNYSLSSPLIVSQPVKEVFVGDEYLYELEVVDDSGFVYYEIVEGPVGMYFNNNILSWSASFENLNSSINYYINESSYWELELLVNVSVTNNNNLSDFQDFILKVINNVSENIDVNVSLNDSNYSSNYTWNWSDFSGLNKWLENILRFYYEKIVSGSEFIMKNDEGLWVSKKNSSALYSSKSNNPIHELLFVYSFSEVRFMTSVSQLTYQYFFMLPIPYNKTGNFEMMYKVDKSWLQERELSGDDVVLLLMDGTGRLNIESQKLYEDENFWYYYSVSPGSGLFSITSKPGKGKLPSFSSSSIKNSYVYLGKVSANVASKALKVKLFNSNSGESVTVPVLKLPDGSYGYNAVVQGDDGDKISVYLNSGISEILVEEGVEANNLINIIDIDKNDVLESFKAYLAIIVLLIIFACLIFFIIRKKKNR